MERRKFIKNTMFTAMAVTTNGYVRFNGENFEGDCATTTDILGPFYRPDAPTRKDMLVKGSTGQLVLLKGQVKHKDCTTPLKNACVELWHCDEKGVYDNESPDFRYRAKVYCDDKGNYEFKTILPVPYDVGNGNFRPAHFHMLVSAPGYQALITQLYFTGDPHNAKDPSSSSPAAKNRVLDVKDDKGGMKSVTFNVSMREKLPADAAVIDRLAGSYARGNGEKDAVFYKKAGLLWIQDPGSINGGYALEYVGNNTFEVYGSPAKFEFKPEMDGSVKLSYTGRSKSWVGVKNK